MYRGLRKIALFLIVLFTATHALAQVTAQINGAVTDSSGGVLPGATVTAVQTDTGFRRETFLHIAGRHVVGDGVSEHMPEGLFT